MARKRLIATRDFTWTNLARREYSYRAGEVFEVEPVEAAALVYQHKAKFAPPEPAPVTSASPRRGRYRRRDLQSEE